MTSEVSPYLAANDRLADVIAAIQAMGTYKFYKLDFSMWADRISGDESQADHWKAVFEQHPEFFRLDAQREKASLVWRRQHQKRFDVDKEAKITRDEYKSLSKEEQKRVSRMPLHSDELAKLVDTAINLHSRALEHKKEARWFVYVAISLIGASGGFVGAIIGAVMAAPG